MWVQNSNWRGRIEEICKWNGKLIPGPNVPSPNSPKYQLLGGLHIWAVHVRIVFAPPPPRPRRTVELLERALARLDKMPPPKSPSRPELHTQGW